MSKNRLDISDNTAISMPVRNMLAIIGAVAVGVWAYFGVLERITMLETKAQLAEKDLESHIERLENDLTKNTEFRIKWPRGEMGALPADGEQFMLIEDLYKSSINMNCSPSAGKAPISPRGHLILNSVFFVKSFSNLSM